MRSGYLVNRLLSQVVRWESIFSMYRDLEPLFDHINLATAMHRLGRTSHAARVRWHPDTAGLHWLPCGPHMLLHAASGSARPLCHVVLDNERTLHCDSISLPLQRLTGSSHLAMARLAR